VCRRHSRAFLRHLFAVNEPAALRLATIHNLAWTLALVERMRSAIETGTFAALRAEVLAVWG
jgi:queuine tRNA-ribosyltransferase